MVKNQSPTFMLAYKFVTKILGREWTNTDWRGQHMRHAAMLLKDGHSEEDVFGTLLAMRIGLIGDVPDEMMNSLMIVTKGEPPYINQFCEMKKNPPPVYLTELRRQWEEVVTQT